MLLNILSVLGVSILLCLTVPDPLQQPDGTRNPTDLGPFLLYSQGNFTQRTPVPLFRKLFHLLQMILKQFALFSRPTFTTKIEQGIKHNWDLFHTVFPEQNYQKSTPLKIIKGHSSLENEFETLCDPLPNSPSPPRQSKGSHRPGTFSIVFPGQYNPYITLPHVMKGFSSLTNEFEMLCDTGPTHHHHQAVTRHLPDLGPFPLYSQGQITPISPFTRLCKRSHLLQMNLKRFAILGKNHHHHQASTRHPTDLAPSPLYSQAKITHIEPFSRLGNGSHLLQMNLKRFAILGKTHHNHQARTRHPTHLRPFPLYSQGKITPIAPFHRL